MAGVAVLATRYIPTKWLDLIKSRFGSMQNFTTDPMGSIRSAVQNAINDPAKTLKQISQAMSPEKSVQDQKNETQEQKNTEQKDTEQKDTEQKNTEQKSEDQSEQKNEIEDSHAPEAQTKIADSDLESAKATSVEAVTPDAESLPGSVEPESENEGVIKTLYNWFIPRT